MSKKLNEEEVLHRLKELQNDYTFRFEGGYKNNYTKNLNVICSNNHEYITAYNKFKQGRRCPECSRFKYTEEDVLEILQELEPNYSFRFENGYKGCMDRNLYVTCEHGHEYNTNYNNFINMKSRCKQCANSNRKLEEQEVLNNLKGMENNYTFCYKDEYKDINTKNLHVICTNNHEYITSYVNFRQGYRCPHCSGKYKPTTEEALDRLKQMQSDYIFRFEDEYINAASKNLVATCPNNHTYITSYNGVQNGYRCPHCVNVKSKPETEIIEYIKTFYNKDIQQGNRKLIKNIHSGKWLEIDIYIPDIKLAIEFNGLYWHSDKVIKENKIGFSNAKEYHEYKTNQCKQLGITLLHIDEQDFIYNKDIILNQIKHMVLYAELLTV